MTAQGAGSADGARHVALASRPIGFWLKLVDQLIDDRFVSALAEYEVSRHQWELMNLLSPGPATLVRLNTELDPFLDRNSGESAAGHLIALVDRGWVDVAFEYYELTGEGATNHAALHRLVARNRSIGLESVSDEDYRTTLDTLEKIARSLGWDN